MLEEIAFSFIGSFFQTSDSIKVLWYYMKFWKHLNQPPGLFKK